MSARRVRAGASAHPEEIQMTFAEVVELERLAGDPDYTAWLQAGRPRITVDEYDALRSTQVRRRQIETLPGL